MTTFDVVEERLQMFGAQSTAGEIFFPKGRFDQRAWVHFPPMHGDEQYETARCTLQTLYDEVSNLTQEWTDLEAKRKAQGYATDELEQAAQVWVARASSLPARIAKGESTFETAYQRMIDLWLKHYSAEYQAELEEERANLLARVTSLNGELLCMFDVRGYMAAFQDARQGKPYVHLEEALVRHPVHGNLIPASQLIAVTSK